MASQSGERTSLAVVYGGGGGFGINYNLGIAHEFIEAGMPLQEAPALGTSAGSWAAGIVALRIPIEKISSDTPDLELPNLAPGLLQDSARQVFDGYGTYAPTVQATAVDKRTNTLVVLNGREVPIVDMVAASSAIPKMLAPVEIGDCAYTDGGSARRDARGNTRLSATSAQRAAHAKRLLVVAPMSGPVMDRLIQQHMPLLPAGTLSFITDAAIISEMRRWELRTDGRASFVRPNEEIARQIKSPEDMFKSAVGARVYELARQQAKQLLKDRRKLAALALG